jgi:hypothetical protein
MSRIGSEGSLRARGSLFRVVVYGSGAAVLYGGWALFANRRFGMVQAARAALVQAVWSFTLTAVLTALTEWSMRRCRARQRPPALAALPSLSLIWIGPVTVHTVNGTPALAATIAPGVTIGTMFVVAHVATLAKRDRPE